MPRTVLLNLTDGNRTAIVEQGSAGHKEFLALGFTAVDAKAGGSADKAVEAVEAKEPEQKPARRTRKKKTEVTDEPAE